MSGTSLIESSDSRYTVLIATELMGILELLCIRYKMWFFHTDDVINDLGIFIFHWPGMGIDSADRRPVSVEGAQWITEGAADMFRRGVFDRNAEIWNPRNNFARWGCIGFQ